MAFVTVSITDLIAALLDAAARISAKCPESAAVRREAIRNTVTTVMEAIRSVITSVWEAIKSAVTAVLSAIKDVVVSAWTVDLMAFHTLVMTSFIALTTELTADLMASHAAVCD